MRYYEKLTDGHFFLDTSAKMRNHLADEVLNERMLKLVLEYIKSTPQSEDSLKGVVDILSQTSKIVDIFRDHRPIRSMEDERIGILKQFHEWLKLWETSAENNRQLLSPECRKDWSSTILAFCAMTKNILDAYPDAEIVPAMFNTDLLENTFGCQRGLVAGTGTNPTVFQYCKNINTITLSTNTISNKSNAGKNQLAVPFNFGATSETYSALAKKST